MSAEIIDLQKYRQARVYADMSAALDADENEFAEELQLLSEIYERKCRTNNYGSGPLQGFGVPGS